MEAVTTEKCQALTMQTVTSFAIFVKRVNQFCTVMIKAIENVHFACASSDKTR